MSKRPLLVALERLIQTARDGDTCPYVPVAHPLLIELRAEMERLYAAEHPALALTPPAPSQPSSQRPEQRDPNQTVQDQIAASRKRRRV